MGRRRTSSSETIIKVNRGYLAYGYADTGSIKTEKFTYLRSELHTSSDIAHDMKTGTDAAWAKWMEVTGFFL